MASNTQRFVDFVTATPKINASALARALGVSRPYVYEIAKKNGYERIDHEWVTADDKERAGDALFQMIAEIHDVVVNRAPVENSEGITHVLPPVERVEIQEVKITPKQWEVIEVDGQPAIVVPIALITRDDRSKVTSAIMAVNFKAGFWERSKSEYQKIAGIIMSAIAHRLIDITNKENES